MLNPEYQDWGEVSDIYDEILFISRGRDLVNANEAQTRFSVIDRFIRDVFQWKSNQISVEEFDEHSLEKKGYVDYILRHGDRKILIEAKKIGATFPSFTKKKRLKLGGSLLGSGAINQALRQAEAYAINKKAEIICVTNGKCWCFYPLKKEDERANTYAYLLFPLESQADAQQLFSYFSLPNVESDSLESILSESLLPSHRYLINTVKDADARLGRNNIADFITPALEYAFYGESIIGDEQKLEFCFVSTDARTKYDNTLKIFVNDRKSPLVSPAKRIKKNRPDDELNTTIRNLNSVSSPVTLLLGSVGAGKSTYLSHFELIHGKNLLKEKKVFWAYIDFEKMGKSGSPRSFIYQTLLELCTREHPFIPTDFENLVSPAYEEEIKALARGPFGLAAKDKEKFSEKIQEKIEKDYWLKEPYVDRIYQFLSAKYTCVIILDNIDLYEDTDLEISVFSEGVALSKKYKASVIVSIRDTTFINHKNESIFNAYELRKFWIDPPPFREVLSKRLKFAGSVLKDKKGTVTFQNMPLQVLDLSIFFDIASSTLLHGSSARFIESIADGNIRKGLNLVSNFLTSAHIQADRSLYNYLSGGVLKDLPFHEVYKGCVLGPWKYYKEERAEVINIFNSGYSKSLLFLRAHILNLLYRRAMDKSTIETKLTTIVETFSKFGASEFQIFNCLNYLIKNNLIRDINSREIDIESSIYIATAGAYYISYLANNFEYLESVMIETPIFNEEVWSQLYLNNEEVRLENNIVAKVIKRTHRMRTFFSYLEEVEREVLDDVGLQDLNITNSMKPIIMGKLVNIVRNAKTNYDI